MRLPCLPCAYRKPVSRGARWRPDPSPRPSVDALTCAAAKDREILWDGGHREAVRGFGVVAFRNGGKCYIAQYRKDGRSRRTRIGEHGRLTPEEARREAEKFWARSRAARTRLHSARRRARCGRSRRSRRFSCPARRDKRKARTGRRIRAHPEPATSCRPSAPKRIVDVRRADVAECTAKLSDSPYQANRALALVSAIWNWAARRDEVAFVG